jgi:primosomal protein N' (replication factor Y)
MQKAVLELLCSLGTVSVKELCYFTGAKSSTVKRLAELGYVNLSAREVLRCRQIRPARIDGPLVLNEEQTAAFEGLLHQMQQEKPGSALLYGVTGSGKTAVYLSLIRRALEMDKAAMLLVPEIALTPQLLSLLAGHFGDQVAVLHSSLPTGERYDQWKRVRSGDARVIVGTRSAVFAPSPRLGLIILDEEQEHSYKSESNPGTRPRKWRCGGV